MCVCMCVPERSGSYWEHLHVREAVTHIAATTHQPPPDPLSILYLLNLNRTQHQLTRDADQFMPGVR